jgi:N-methylhydantoinase A/oxoprolinase/acetone carboxylase beta subunit
MGGTSTDVCLVLGGVPEPTAERTVGGLPVRMPSLDIHTIGAGGGSIAALDPGGALTVGPHSAGARPGPASYGHGGVEPTVTDANLVVEHIPAGIAFPGLGILDRTAAEEAHRRAGVEPDGVLQVVNANMERALRTVSIERGVDARGLALVAFGGAGPLHACALADALDMPVVIVPPRAGVLSAVGLMCAPPQVDLVRSWVGGDAAALDAARRRLADEAMAQLGGADEVETSIDCRYEGQSHEITVVDLPSFHAEHERRNGYTRPEWPVEVTAIRASARRRARLGVTDLPAVSRPTGAGPTVLAEEDCTVWVPEGWRARLGEVGALVLERTS